MRTPIAFLVGAIAATLVAAAAFRGAGQPLDSTFTYQGQLRNAGQLVNGPVDVRFTLWDSDVAGSQIGTANSFNNYPLADGRFALGLNFGAGAFNGDQRWVQVEFRSPAAVGQYLTLNPRDKINATPYALYALNGVESQWSYNSKTQALSTAVGKVGIGTTTPTASLEVVGAGGDDAVKLPAGSIGVSELSRGIGTVGNIKAQMDPANPLVTKAFTISEGGFLILSGEFRGGYAASLSTWMRHTVVLDGVVIYETLTHWGGDSWPPVQVHEMRAIGSGTHTIELRASGSGPEYWSWHADDDLYVEIAQTLLFE
jgi:hypothetical protein